MTTDKNETEQEHIDRVRRIVRWTGGPVLIFLARMLGRRGGESHGSS